MNILSSDDFRREIKKGLSGGYLFFGDEDYLKLNALKSARSAVCADETFSFFNDLTIDPLKFNADSLLDALMPLPMMGDQKIVSVSGIALSSLKAEVLEPLCDVFSSLDEHPFNVLIVSVPADGMEIGRLPKAPSPLLKKLSTYLKPVHFTTPPIPKLILWCQKHFMHNGVMCEDSLCREIFSRCGTSMFTLAAEIDKLSFYVRSKGRDKVLAEDIPLVTCSVIEEETFALTNALLDGKSAKALEALSVMKFNRVDPVNIFAEISRTISELIAVKALLDDGKTAVEINSIMKAEPFKLKDYPISMRIAAAPSKSMEKLRRALALCAEADRAVKLSGGYAVLEQLLSTI